jgi:hypothetical protein
MDLINSALSIDLNDMSYGLSLLPGLLSKRFSNVDGGVDCG